MRRNLDEFVRVEQRAHGAIPAAYGNTPNGTYCSAPSKREHDAPLGELRGDRLEHQRRELRERSLEAAVAGRVISVRPSSARRAAASIVALPASGATTTASRVTAQT